MEKKDIMDKIIRELDDINNSSTSLLKKVAQVEAENINLGNKMLEEKVPAMFEHIDGIVEDSSALVTEFTAMRDKFVSDNKLDEEPDVN